MKASNFNHINQITFVAMYAMEKDIVAENKTQKNAKIVMEKR